MKHTTVILVLLLGLFIAATCNDGIVNFKDFALLEYEE